MLFRLLHEIEKKALLLASVTLLSKLDQDTRKSYRPVSLMNLDTNKHNKTVANQNSRSDEESWIP